MLFWQLFYLLFFSNLLCPSCAHLSCIRLLATSAKPVPQYLHTWGFNPRWMFVWSSSFDLVMKPLLQTLHTKGFKWSGVCTVIIWQFILSVLMSFPHWAHGMGVLFLLCLFWMCSFKCLLFLQIIPHWSQVCGSAFPWTWKNQTQ